MGHSYPRASGPVGAARSGSGHTLGVVVVAAGGSRRMAGVDKIFSPLLGAPLIAHTIEALEASPMVDSLVLVVAPDKLEAGLTLARERGWHKVNSVCRGGSRRQDSVKLGLDQLPPCSWVAVHDGARPCIGTELLERGLEAARETGAAVAAVPAKDTIKSVSSLHLVESTPPRDSLWMVQTPQVFRYELLLEAHRTCQETVTDDASMVERLGHRVKVFMGSYDNLKVTTAQDLAVAEVLLRASRTLAPERSGHPDE